MTLPIFNSLRHSAGPLAIGLQAQRRGCVKLVGGKGGLRKRWFVKKLVWVKLVCVKADLCTNWLVKVGWCKTWIV